MAIKMINVSLGVLVGRKDTGRVAAAVLCVRANRLNSQILQRNYGLYMTSLNQFTSLELVLDCRSRWPWSSRVRALCVLASAAYAYLHHLCETTFRLNWRTAILVDGVLNLVFSRGFLSAPTLTSALW